MDVTERQRYGKRLRRARLSRGLGLVETAEALGKSPSTVATWEAGAIPNAVDAVRLARLLGTRAEVLFGGEAANTNAKRRRPRAPSAPPTPEAPDPSADLTVDRSEAFAQ